MKQIFKSAQVILGLALSLIVAGFIGCSKDTERTAVENLKKHIAWANIIPNNHWDTISYDVIKTDSLISPYIATIKAVYYYDDHIDTDTTHIVFKYKYDIDMSLAWQETQWVAKRIVVTQRMKNEVSSSWDVWNGKLDKEITKKDDSYDWNIILGPLLLSTPTPDYPLPSKS